MRKCRESYKNAPLKKLRWKALKNTPKMLHILRNKTSYNASCRNLMYTFYFPVLARSEIEDNTSTIG